MRRSYSVEAKVGGKWVAFSTGVTVGAKRSDAAAAANMDYQPT